MIIALIIIGWFGCGFLAAGFIFAFFQKKFYLIAKECRVGDFVFSLFLVIFGPLYLIGTIISLWSLNTVEVVGHGWGNKGAEGKPFFYGWTFPRP
jgi:hypothetical protein